MDANTTNNGNLSGTLLIAHPGLKDPNFKRTVVLVSTHKSTVNEGGALGVVLNHPLGIGLGDINQSLQMTPLGGVPIYRGGPVSPNQVILTAWQWIKPKQTFKLYFGISPKIATDILEMFPETHIRAFLGHAGWGAGQIEQEVKEKAWLLSPIKSIIHAEPLEEKLWFHLMSQLNPLLLLFNGMPDDPIAN